MAKVSHQRRGVSFSENNRTYPPRNPPLTVEEHQATWYNARDFAEFKHRNRCLGATMRRRRFVSSGGIDCDVLVPTKVHSASDEAEETKLLSGDVIRGIEHLCCATYYDERKRKKAAAVQAVLVEQRKQRYMNLCDYDALALISCRHTAFWRDMAAELGSLDAVAVHGVTDEDATGTVNATDGSAASSVGDRRPQERARSITGTEPTKAVPLQNTQCRTEFAFALRSEAPEVRDWAPSYAARSSKCKRTPACVM